MISFCHLSSHSNEYSFFSDKTISTPLTGYITNLSQIEHKMLNNKKYFDFQLLTKEQSNRTVCFSPENYKLLKVIEQENDGCEIKHFKSTERDEILLSDYTSIKKMELNFMQPIHNAVFQEKSKVENELPLFDMATVKGIE